MTPQEVRVNGGSLSDLKLPSLALGLPAELLVRRPDLRKAEADLVAAGANLQAARAAMLPRIDISIGSTLSAVTLGGPGALAWSLASGIFQSIFDGGRLAGQRDVAEARRNELIENYRQAILVSLRDVEDALVALRQLGEQQEAQQRALDHAREAYRLAEIRWRAGAEDFTYRAGCPTELDQFRGFTRSHTFSTLRRDRRAFSKPLAVTGTLEPRNLHRPRARRSKLNRRKRRQQRSGKPSVSSVTSC
jgi:hypothetical protein